MYILVSLYGKVFIEGALFLSLSKRARNKKSHQKTTGKTINRNEPGKKFGYEEIPKSRQEGKEFGFEEIPKSRQETCLVAEKPEENRGGRERERPAEKIRESF